MLVDNVVGRGRGFRVEEGKPRCSLSLSCERTRNVVEERSAALNLVDVLG